MTRWRLLGPPWFLAILFAAALSCMAGTTPAPPERIVASQQEAVRKYPDLGVQGTPLNRLFLARVQEIKSSSPAYFQQPDWPQRLADECAARLPALDRRPAAPGNVPPPLWPDEWDSIIFVVGCIFATVVLILLIVKALTSFRDVGPVGRGLLKVLFHFFR